MPLLGGLLITLFGGIASFLVQFIAKKAALAIAAVATFGLLTAGLIAGLQLLVAGLITAFPESNPVFLSMLWVAIPDNAAACVSVCIATDTACALYRWNAANVKLAASVN
jgi:hypothetical protein